jgi:hypothetical protein
MSGAAFIGIGLTVAEAHEPACPGLEICDMETRHDCDSSIRIAMPERSMRRATGYNVQRLENMID